MKCRGWWRRNFSQKSSNFLFLFNAFLWHSWQWLIDYLISEPFYSAYTAVFQFSDFRFLDLVKNDARVQVSFDFHSMNTHFIDTKLILWQARLQIYSLQTSMPALMHQVFPIIAFRLKCRQLIPFPQDSRPLHTNVRIQIRHYGSKFVWTICMYIGRMTGEESYALVQNR